MEFLEAFKAAVNAAELQEPRRVVCRTLSNQLDACGERLWAFGCGGLDFRTALSLVVQFGGSLSTGAVALAEHSNWYTASALVRQLIEVEYLVRLFRRVPEQACIWLRASSSDLRHAFSPSTMRKRIGKGEFRHQEYAVHCEIGGHPNPRAHFLLPARVLDKHRNPFGSNELFWIDLAQHLRIIWADIQAIPTDHPNENLDVILQYTPVVTATIKLWEGVDPCSPMLPPSLHGELAAVRASAQQAAAADG